MHQQPGPSLHAGDVEIVSTQTAADRTRRDREAAILLDEREANEHAAAAGASGRVAGHQRPEKRQRTAGTARVAAVAVPVKRELTSDAKKELRELEMWYRDERTEQIRPGDVFFAEDVPAEEQLRLYAPRIISTRASLPGWQRWWLTTLAACV